MQLFTRPQLCNDGGAGWLIFPYVWLELELNGIDAVPFDRFFWDAWLGIGYDGLPVFFSFVMLDSCWMQLICSSTPLGLLSLCWASMYLSVDITESVVVSTEDTFPNCA